MELVTERLIETGPLFSEFYKWEAFPPSSLSRIRCSQCACIVNFMLTECTLEVMIKMSSAFKCLLSYKGSLWVAHLLRSGVRGSLGLGGGVLGEGFPEWKSTLLDNNQVTVRSPRSHTKDALAHEDSGGWAETSCCQTTESELASPIFD